MTYGMGQNEHTLEQHACFTEYLKLYEDRLADYIGASLSLTCLLVETSRRERFYDYQETECLLYYSILVNGGSYSPPHPLTFCCIDVSRECMHAPHTVDCSVPRPCFF
jgi:hypothetical protein